MSKIDTLIRNFSQFLFSRKIRGFGRLAKIVSDLYFTNIPNQDVNIKTKYGFEIITNPNLEKSIGIKLFKFGSYEAGTLGFMMSYLKKGDIFVDIGANIGLMTLHASKLVGEAGRVFSIEPSKTTYEKLVRNVELNNLKNVKALNFGLGSTAQIKKLILNSDPGMNTFVDGSSNLNSFEEVKIEVYDDLEIFKNTNPDLIKIDVEGFELDVLRGLQSVFSNNNGPAFIVECSSNRENNYFKKELFDFFIGKNYKMFKLKLSKERFSELLEITAILELPLHDNIFCFNEFQVKELKNIKLIH